MRVIVNFVFNKAFAIHCIAEDARTVVSGWIHVTDQATLMRGLRGFTRPWRYAVVGGPNQVESASVRSGWVPSPTHATNPSGRTKTAVGAVTAPIAGRPQAPAYSASID